MTFKEMRQTRRAGPLKVKKKGIMICYIMNRRESKCCPVLMKHRRKVIGEQVIILQMDQELKTKNISDVSGQLFCCQCKDKFLLETD